MQIFSAHFLFYATRLNPGVYTLKRDRHSRFLRTRVAYHTESVIRSSGSETRARMDVRQTDGRQRRRTTQRRARTFISFSRGEFFKYFLARRRNSACRRRTTIIESYSPGEGVAGKIETPSYASGEYRLRY